MLSQGCNPYAAWFEIRCPFNGWYSPLSKDTRALSPHNTHTTQLKWIFSSYECIYIYIYMHTVLSCWGTWKRLSCICWLVVAFHNSTTKTLSSLKTNTGFDKQKNKCQHFIGNSHALTSWGWISSAYPKVPSNVHHMETVWHSGEADNVKSSSEHWLMGEYIWAHGGSGTVTWSWCNPSQQFSEHFLKSTILGNFGSQNVQVFCVFWECLLSFIIFLKAYLHMHPKPP